MVKKRYSKKEKRKIIINYIKQNPEATYKDIRKNTKLHPERVFNSLKEAFTEAKIKHPRTFEIKTKEQKKKIIIEYIKKNPKAGGHTIKKDTKINFQEIFSKTEEAFKAAGVKYPRKIDSRTKEEKKKQIIQLVKENHLITMEELRIATKTKPYNLFSDIKDIYREASIKPIKSEEKWKIKKQKQVTEFIKKNPLATQREINKHCKTHVQELFKRGIFEAYEKAGIKFPFERLKLYGIGLKETRERAKTFEEKIAIKLSGYGKVNRLVKTKRGVADIILERKNKKAIIEVKDYKKKDISRSQITQLNRYLEDTNCNLGFLICHKKPKKDRFLIEKNKIFLLEKEETKNIPFLIDGLVV